MEALQFSLALNIQTVQNAILLYNSCVEYSRNTVSCIMSVENYEQVIQYSSSFKNETRHVRSNAKRTSKMRDKLISTVKALGLSILSMNNRQRAWSDIK